MQKGLLRVGVFDIDEVIPYVFTREVRRKLKEGNAPYFGVRQKKLSCREYPALIDGQLKYISVGMGSHRYQIFAKEGTDCVKCGLKGRFFALERHLQVGANPLKFHFNLYAIDHKGNEVLMTKDHIIPRSRGGQNVIENYQPMCEKCNTKKADLIPEHASAMVAK